jgi:ATP-dependent Clp protease adaptor protein ClpS
MRTTLVFIFPFAVCLFTFAFREAAFAFRILSMPEREHGFDEEVATETRERLKRPPLFRVLLHNDDFTTMEFVVEVLRLVFGKGEAEAFRIMWAVHTEGLGVAGVYTYEIAEMKVERVTHMAREHEYPLLCTIEEEPQGD